MNKFPYYQHFGIEINFKDDKLVDEKLVDEMANKLIIKLGLNVVKESKYEFTNHGLTKFWVLSQSHMIFHTWPEFAVIHIDLMTCSGEIKQEDLQEVVDEFNPEKVQFR